MIQSSYRIRCLPSRSSESGRGEPHTTVVAICCPWSRHITTFYLETELNDDIARLVSNEPILLDYFQHMYACFSLSYGTLFSWGLLYKRKEKKRKLSKYYVAKNI